MSLCLVKIWLSRIWISFSLIFLDRQLGISYCLATTAATGTALGLNRLVKVSALRSNLTKMLVWDFRPHTLANTLIERCIFLNYRKFDVIHVLGICAGWPDLRSLSTCTVTFIVNINAPWMNDANEMSSACSMLLPSLVGTSLLLLWPLQTASTSRLWEAGVWHILSNEFLPWTVLHPLFLTSCRELSQGIPVFTEDGTRVGDSTAAAKKAIGQVVISRIVMACPGMCGCPWQYLHKFCFHSLTFFP